MENLDNVLEEKIRNSVELKMKLNNEQIDKFIKKALSLSIDGKTDLINQFDENFIAIKKEEKREKDLVMNYKIDLYSQIRGVKKNIREEREFEFVLKNDPDKFLENELNKII